MMEDKEMTRCGFCWEGHEGAACVDSCHNPDCPIGATMVGWPHPKDEKGCINNSPRLKCRLCLRGASDINGYLHRVNEKGVIGVWECRPFCNTNISNEEAVTRAVRGESWRSDLE